MFAPHREGDPVTGQQLRAFPIARLEAAINQRRFALAHPEGGASSDSALEPLGAPKRTADFYELVAAQHRTLTQRGEANPSAVMAALNGVALSTAQGWVTRARARGLLPPGRRGRAG